MLSCHFPAPMIPTLFSVSRRIRQNSKGKFKKDHLFWGGWGGTKLAFEWPLSATAAAVLVVM